MAGGAEALQVLDAVARAQRSFIAHGHGRYAYPIVLTELLALFGSDAGCLAEVMPGSGDTAAALPLAVSGVGWDDVPADALRPDAGADGAWVRHAVTHDGAVVGVAAFLAPTRDPGAETEGSLGPLIDALAAMIVASRAGPGTSADAGRRFQIELQKVAAEASAMVAMATSEESFDRAVDEALRRLGELLEVDRAYLFRYSDDLALITNTHEWCAEGVSPERDRFQNFPSIALPWLQERLLELQPVHIPSVEALPPEAEVERISFEEQDIKSLLVIPTVGAHGRVAGFVGFDAVAAPVTWPEEQIVTLRLFADTLGGTLAQRGTAAALREALERLELLAAHVPGVLYQYHLRPDGTSHFPYASAGIRGIYGVTPDEVVEDATPVFGVLHPEDLDGVAASIAKSAETLTDWHDVYRVNLPGGRTNWVEGYASPQPLPDGSILWHGYIQDITERRGAEEELRLGYAALRAAANGVVITDRHGEIAWVNDAFTRMTGYTAAEAVGQHTRLLRSGRHDDGFYRGLWETVSAGEVWRGEITNRRKDGTLYVENMTITPVQSGAEGVTHFIAVKEDVTQRIEDEADRERLREQLNQAQKVESLGRLAGGVAHDFNNMLSIIQGHSELAMEALGPRHPVAEDILSIRKAAERSAAIARQLLGFARKQTVAPKVLDLNEAVEATLSMLRRLIGENMSLTWEPGPDVGPVRMDPSQLDQILTNLCVNARDAVGYAGSIAIGTGVTTFDESFCAAHPGAEPGDYVTLTVTDDGHGMTPDMMGRIFEPFFTTKEVGAGTGLGLSTVYGIVKQNGGFVDVRSEVDRGTTFRVCLPVHRGEPVETALVGADQRSASRSGRETILLVEDDPGILAVTSRMLEGMGYSVLAAPSPREALEVAEARGGRIDLLLTDVIMPEMNGRQLSERLVATYPELRTLFMSGYTADIIANQGVLESGVRLIQKPFSREDLARGVAEVLGRV